MKALNHPRLKLYEHAINMVEAGRVIRTFDVWCIPSCRICFNYTAEEGGDEAREKRKKRSLSIDNRRLSSIEWNRDYVFFSLLSQLHFLLSLVGLARFRVVSLGIV